MTRSAPPTNADLAARLLRDIAGHYRVIARENPEVADEMEANARTCEEVADRVERDPTGLLTDA